MSYIFKETNVFDESLNRIRFVYDECDDVIVAMSGGKDSTVLFQLTLMVAKERNRLPLKVFWLDQEAEWQHTVDYMDKIMRMPEVEPYWFQVPFDFTNSLSHQSNFLRVWDEECPDKWIHQKSDIAIKEFDYKKTRFHEIYKELQTSIASGNHTAVLCGMRISESPARRLRIVGQKSQYKGITWCSKLYGKKCRQFYPIYDFTNDDIWTAIGKNHWEYNPVYDLMYRWGLPKQRMRVSSLIHETAWHSIEMLQEFEPETYNKFLLRVHGTSAFSHAFEEGGVMVEELPFMFKDWKEYRDYLLLHIVKPEYWDLFKKRWENQNTEKWYKVHAKECIINDIDGTINRNEAIKLAQHEAREKRKNI